MPNWRWRKPLSRYCGAGLGLCETIARAARAIFYVRQADGICRTYAPDELYTYA